MTGTQFTLRQDTPQNKLILGRKGNSSVDLLHPIPLAEDYPKVLRDWMEKCDDIARKCFKKAA